MGFDLFGNIGTAVAAPMAADRQLEALKNARGMQQAQYQTNKGYLDPYYGTGTDAMRSLYGNVQGGAYNVNVSPQDMQSDPGFQFRLEQGQKALERSAAAHGGLMSGGFAKGLADYSQGLASQEYGNIWNRKFQQNQFNYNSLANLAGMGERAGNNLMGLGERYGNTMAGMEMNRGNIRAASLMSQFQAGGAAADAGTSAGINLGMGAATGGASMMGGGIMGGGGGGGGMAGPGGGYTSMNPADYAIPQQGNPYGGGQSLGGIGYAPGIPTQGGSYYRDSGWGPAAGGYG